ncbi:MAG TPA: NUDIX hydrolase [Propionibacteriaceae bacterium]|nr:NUDIX hydrolase [Micropruina sp.]HBX80988.1 NUDIX hydrolase [Propionibacteriaceae bacterium]HBY21983.1 NUDIX hydrolase [Propionibacteriaceae bacterium]
MTTEPIIEIVAAGTVTLHRPEDAKQPRVLVIHRPGYNDWTLPKGKPEPGENLALTAVRETQEETGVSVRLDTPLDDITYSVSRGPKTVSYWRASVTGIVRRPPNKEVDKVVWLTPKVAMKRLTYEDERALLAQALSQPETTPILVIRHGKAMLRKNWPQRDSARPLTTRGRHQTLDLADLMRCYRVESLASSTTVRCLSTLRPYAKEHRLDIRGWATLSEEQGAYNEGAVAKLVSRLSKEAAMSDRALAICTHRPILPTILESVGVAERLMRTGTACVVHMTPEGESIAVEWHHPLW